MLTSSAFAQNPEYGVGMMAGDPSGVSLKRWSDAVHALDAAAGWSTGKRRHLDLHADYLWHDYTAIKVERGRLPVYYGLGARLRDREGDRTRLGMRIPFGLSYLLDSAPLEFFAELVPRLDLTPDTDFAIDAALGIRYRFSPAR